MSVVLFFYGLAFIAMGVIFVSIPRNKDFLGILDNLWFLAAFGFIRGINAWINMLVINPGRMNAKILSMSSAVLLPVSFLFILIFAVLNLRQSFPKCKWLRFIPLLCLIPWFAVSAGGKGAAVSNIAARYFICLPGMILLLADIARRAVLFKKESPRFVFLSAVTFISSGALYAVVAGIIVPQADFFPASVFNYSNFIMIFGFPVQVIRILCVLVMTAAVFGMTGVFYKDGEKVRLVGGVRRKVLIFTALFSAVFLIASVLMFYLSGLFTLRQSTFRHQQAIVQLMAGYVGEMIESEVEELENYVAYPNIWVPAIEDANKRYAGLSDKEIQDYLRGMNEEWTRAAPDSRLVSRYTAVPVLGKRLGKFIERKGNIAEMFFTDKYGGLILASGKTDKFYQGDKDWWGRVFAGGKGGIFIGDLEFDQAEREWSITICIPVYGGDSALIGFCGVVYNTLKFSEAVSRFRIGLTGYAILFDEHGGIICQSGHKPIRAEGKVFPEWKIIKKEEQEKDPRFFAYVRHGSGGVFFASWSVVPSELLIQQGVKWTACVEQNTREIFGNQEFMLLLYSMVLFIVLAVLSVYFSFLMMRLLIRPIENMRLGLHEISMGNLNYHLNLKGGDEFEDLSDSFNATTDTLRQTLVSKDALEGEVAERKQTEDELKQARDKLEKQAEELNLQLKEAARAHEIMMSMLEDNNDIRDALEKSLAELKQTQEMMLQVGKLSAVGQLASGVAHEVKNPLGIILQGINYLEKKIPSGRQDIGEVLVMMKNGIDRADRIINGLLDFSKSNKLDFRPEDINSVLENSINLAQLSSRFSDVQVVKELGSSLPKVKIDKNKMEQVFINILVNAAQAIENKGTITVRSYVAKLEKVEKSRINKDADCFSAGEEVLKVEVEDTGEGISEENLNKIFDAFFSTKGPKGGAGLGMGICLSIVDMHKGLIDVDSRPGKGTKVTITLKLLEDGKCPIGADGRTGP
ncbi:MAG: ATP-binding protein [Candidatus Omnitrophota bacterium]